MELEIFKGRKGKYNREIIKILYEEGHSSAWEIAKAIAMKALRGKKVNWYHKTQKVYSVLVRKNGTLKRLLNKEFIEKTDEGYCLTIYKGFCLALTLYQNLKEPAIDDLSKAYKVFPELKETREIISRLHPTALVEQYEVMRRITKELLDQGWNLDVVSNRQFNQIFNTQFSETFLQELRDKKGAGKKWEPNPELQESILKFLHRLKKVLSEQVKELDKEFNSFEKSLRRSKQQKSEIEA